MSENKHIPKAENPETLLNLRLTLPSESAAGLTGVGVAVKHVFSEMNMVRGVKALFSLNQKGGFDCPSCAWPDPDDDRSQIGEYCENGAKAVAEEATTKKLTADFFAKNSVADLSELNDYEIVKTFKETPTQFCFYYGETCTHLLFESQRRIDAQRNYNYKLVKYPSKGIINRYEKGEITYNNIETNNERN